MTPSFPLMTHRSLMLAAVASAVVMLSVTPAWAQSTATDAKTPVVSEADIAQAKAEVEKLRAMGAAERADYFKAQHAAMKDRSPEERKAAHAARKAYMQSLPEAERTAMKAEMKAQRDAYKAEKKAKWDAMTPEEKAAKKAERKAKWDAMSPEEKEKMKAKKEAYKKMKDKKEDKAPE